MKAKGFTLIEIAVVLAVIAVLAAILTPLVTAYIDQARTTRTAADVRAIAQAYQLHKRDTGQFPIYADDTDSDSDTSVADELVSTGDLPAAANEWAFTTTADLESHINLNKLGLSTTNPRRGRVAYRGPYLGTINEDPFGNAYLVNAANLARSSTNIGYVVSAGPDGVIDTERDQVSSGSLTVSNDDIAVRIN